MSNIEPTCSSCGRHATVVDPRNDAMRCVDYPKCDFPKPTNIEPTEEQRVGKTDPTKEQAVAAYEFCATWGDRHAMADHEDIARFLAEREAKLREEVARLESLCTEEARLIVERDNLRAREAQHLADIKAGRKAVAAWLDDPWLEGRRKLGENFMAATAHYDDAKAAEGGEG